MGLERKLQSSKERKHQRVLPSTVSVRHEERQWVRGDQDTTVRNNAVLWFPLWAIFPRKASQLKLTTKEPRGFSSGPGPKILCKDQAGGEGLEHHFYCHIGPFCISLDYTAAVMLLGATKTYIFVFMCQIVFQWLDNTSSPWYIWSIHQCQGYCSLLAVLFNA